MIPSTVSQQENKHMQNMIRVEDSMGVIHVYFDVKDGDIVNISAQDNGKPMKFNEDEMRSYLSREYVASTLEMALVYKSGMVPLMC
jgi:hypothetical protein